MIKYIKSKIGNNLDINKLGYLFFLIGLFFLASAVGISIIFLLISVIIGFLRYKEFFKDKWNYPFLFSSFFMIVSTFIHFESAKNPIFKDIDPNLSLIGLLNWIPFFLSFWAFQQYLNTTEKRIIAAKLLIIGSIPVIFSGILQLLNINGPFELFNGLVIWFQKPLSDVGSISGLFNNQNYAGLWMVMIWPFCLSELQNKIAFFPKKIILILICILYALFIFLTDSRNAILGLLISSPIVLGSSIFIWYLPALIISLLLLGFAVIPIFPESLQIFMKSIIPSRIYTLFPEIGFEYINTYPRINKWLAALNYILRKPIFGWGAATFPILYKFKSGEWFGHAHNLPLEIAVSYGLIPSIIIFSAYIGILYTSFKIIFLKKENFYSKYISSHHRAWFAASMIFFISHLFDIQYFDARISIYCWILLAGLRSIMKEGENIKLDNNFLFK
tara:strand:- start:18967 stop:20301 length:1335 start_codon:yes stop_codon:yes gene_type:complete